MKRSKKLIYLVCILAVCIIAYNIVVTVTNNMEKKEAGDAVTELKSSDISKLSWTYNGTQESIEKDGDTWVYSKDSELPLNTVKSDGMIDSLVNLKSKQVIADMPENLSDYGLDKPEIVIDVTKTDGTTLKLNLGAVNEITSEVYLTLDEKIYMVESGFKTQFETTAKDLIKMEDIPLMSDINKIEYQGLSIEKRSEAMEENPDKPTSSEKLEEEWHVSDGSESAADSSKVSEITSLIQSMSWTECENYKATEAELAQFGLDAPKELKIKYTEDDSEQEFVLLIGNVEGEDAYAKLQNSKMVYKMKSELIEKLNGTTMESLKKQEE